MIKDICLFMSPSENSFLYPEILTRLPLNLGLGIISGYLQERGYKISIKDLNAELADRFKENKKRFEIIYDADKFQEYIRQGEDPFINRLMEDIVAGMEPERFDIFGISIGADFSFLQIQLGFILAKYLKIKYGKPVFMGGNNISFLYIFKDIFKDLWKIVLEEFQFIIHGAGEQVIEAIIDGLDQNQSREYFTNIDGIIHVQDNEIISNPTKKPMVILPDWADLDMSCYTRGMIAEEGAGEKTEKAVRENIIYFYKWPDTYLDSPGLIVNRYNRLKRKDVVEKLIIPYIFNYNCPFNCAFCTQSDYERGGIIGAAAGQVIRDIKILKDKYDTNYFYFLNNAFNFSPNFIEEFCSLAIEEELGIIWSDCGRFNNLTYERLQLMKKAGCTKLTFGFESGSIRIIRLIDKQIDLEQAEQVLKWCYDLGILADIEVIIGLPQEMEADFIDTCNFITKNKKYINYFWVNEFFVIPNSLIGRYPERYGVELIRDNNNYKDLLQANLKLFRNESDDIMTSNSKLYGFNEMNGRSFREIVEANRKKMIRINQLQNAEIDFSAKFYKMLCSK